MSVEVIWFFTKIVLVFGAVFLISPFIQKAADYIHRPLFRKMAKQEEKSNRFRLSLDLKLARAIYRDLFIPRFIQWVKDHPEQG